jgi:hypothetical protein
LNDSTEILVKEIIMWNNKFLFYLLSFTWGLPMTIIGVVVAITLRALGYEPRKWGYCYYFEIGERWGGVNFGPIFLTSSTPSAHTKTHEHGHAIQNCLLGPLMLFSVSIPSAIRYWCRRWVVSNGLADSDDLPAYDAVWYERDATKFGTEFMQWYNNNTK